MHDYEKEIAAKGSLAIKDGSVKKRRQQVSEPRFGNQRGFSMIELAAVCAVMLVILAIALFSLPSMMQSTRSDTALREVMDQMRQAREYSISYRRYVQVTLTTVGSQAQVQIIQRNDLTSGAAATNPVLSTVPIQSPVQFTLFTGVGAPPDTPDAFGNSSAIEFGGANGGPPSGMLFQSDGELVNGGTVVAGSTGSGTPISGSVFLGIIGQNGTARAVTVMGTTGRVHGWKWNGASWVLF
jgi:prepilin-type N-terminal cleavage/methylation domain-containing protein